jgi:hypothetical protein
VEAAIIEKWRKAQRSEVIGGLLGSIDRQAGVPARSGTRPAARPLVTVDVARTRSCPAFRNARAHATHPAADARAPQRSRVRVTSAARRSATYGTLDDATAIAAAEAAAGAGSRCSTRRCLRPA